MNLTNFTCTGNNLDSLNLSKNPLITGVECSNNKISKLNTIGAVKLSSLKCSNNNIVDLNISQNKMVSSLYCSNNLLTVLNIKNGNNKNFFRDKSNIVSFDATKNTNLKCIEVDSVDNSWNTGKDSTAIFSTNCSLLPLVLSSLNATENGKSIQINWHTSTELNTSHFIIQHSTDGSSFTDIGTVKAIGSGANSYTFADNKPTNGINYYRLQSVDKDGSFAYSKVVSVQFTVNSNQLSVFPNPSNDKVTVRGNHIASVQVIDNLGRVLKTVSFKDASNPTLALTGMPAGIYHLRIQTTDGKVSLVNFVVN